VVVDVVDGVVVGVEASSEADGDDASALVEGGGAASVLRGADPPPSPSPPLYTNTRARIAANANMATVPASSATCARLNRDRLAGATGATTGGFGT
jgi:hypothetical protein